MKSREIVGRKIVGVKQKRTVDNTGKVVYDVYHLKLDNGTMLVFSVAELPDDYAVEASVIQPKKETSNAKV